MRAAMHWFVGGLVMEIDGGCRPGYWGGRLCVLESDVLVDGPFLNVKSLDTAQIKIIEKVVVVVCHQL